MLKKLFPIALLLLMSSCVSSKIYEDLQSKYDALKAENEALMAQLDAKGGGSESLSVQRLQKEIEKLKGEKAALAMDLSATQNKYNRLKESYDALEANSSSALTENLERNRKLLEQLEAKDQALNEEAARLVFDATAPNYTGDESTLNEAKKLLRLNFTSLIARSLSAEKRSQTPRNSPQKLFFHGCEKQKR